MWEINSLIEVVAFLALGINVICFFVFSKYKTVKSYKVRKRLINIYGIVTIGLIMALAINVNATKSAEHYYIQNIICPLLVIILQACAGFCVVLKIEGNYKKRMIIGNQYNFFVGTVDKERVLGYVVIDGSYIEAVTENVPDYNLEEQDEIKVTLVQDGFEDEEVIVRI